MAYRRCSCAEGGALLKSPPPALSDPHAVSEHAQRQYDDWNGVSINVTAFEWMAVMGHLAFQAKLSGKPECNIHHHFLVTVTWSLQLWKLCMRKKISQRACSITNASIIAWIMTAHTTLIAVDDKCVNFDPRFLRGSLPAMALVNAVFVFTVYCAFPPSMSHAPPLLCYSTIMSAATGYMQHTGSNIFRGFDPEADPDLYGLVVAVTASCLGAQAAFLCRCIAEEIDLKAFLLSSQRR